MNRIEIIAALDDALLTISKPSSVKTEEGERVLDDVVDSILLHKLAAPVKEVLDQQDEYRERPNLMINTGQGLSGFQSQFVAPMLVQQARESGSVVAADWLEAVFRSTEATGTYVMILWGINPSEAVALGEGVQLIPFVQLPPSRQKSNIEEMKHPISFGPHGPILQKTPSAALCAHPLKIAPFLTDAGAAEPQDPIVSESRDHLRDVALCLTLVGPSKPVEGASWFQFDDPVHDKALMGTITAWSQIEISSMQLEPLGSFDGRTAQQVVEGYSTLTGDLRKKVRIALDRLNRSLRRRDVGDRAIELAIALETLLMDGQGEFTFKLALRAALLSSSKYDVRKQNRKVIEGVYKLRSSLVHDGVVKPKLTLHGDLGPTPSEDIVGDGSLICAQVIQKVIMGGEVPDWWALEMGSN